MTRRVHSSETPGTSVLRSARVHFEPLTYAYVDHGGTAESAKQLGVDEHHVIKTLVMADEDSQPLIVLMHGDREVSLKALAREIGCKSVTPCNPEVAQRHSGYQVGGTSPFGLRKAMPIYVERTILDLDSIVINGGRRGFLVRIDPAVLLDVLSAIPVTAATAG